MVEELPERVWSDPSPLRGIEMDLEAQLAYLERELAPHVREFDPPESDPGRAGEFFLDNQAYERVDAELLYATIRRWKPKRVLELGSGFSTLVSAEACAANEREGHSVELTVVDPFALPRHSGPIADVATLRCERAQNLPLEEFEALADGDILFVDTSHTVKAGGDVNFVVLDVLPALRPGVVVHFHDIFLPWEYPREWLDDGIFWTEQYLVQAFLAFNREFEVLFAAHHVSREAPERLGRIVPSLRPETKPGALWVRRRMG